MNEPRPDDLPKPPLNAGWKLSLTVACLGGGLLVWLGINAWQEIDPIVEPTPSSVDFPATEEQRAALSPKVRVLLEKVEANEVSGKLANDFAEVLAEADNASVGKRSRRYLFSLDGHTSDLEGHPVVYVQVQVKTGRVIHCGVTVPTW